MEQNLHIQVVCLGQGIFIARSLPLSLHHGGEYIEIKLVISSLRVFVELFDLLRIDRCKLCRRKTGLGTVASLSFQMFISAFSPADAPCKINYPSTLLVFLCENRKL